MALAACEPDAVAEHRVAVSGGRVAAEPEWDAVLCVPQSVPSLGCADIGWGVCITRCTANMTLVAPGIAMGPRDRAIEQSHPIELGTRTRTQGAAADVAAARTNATAWELGTAVDVTLGPDLLAHAVGCFELRRSGLAPCCRHVYVEDPSLGTTPPPLVGPYRRVYSPPEALWDTPYSDPAHGVTLVPYGWSPSATYRQYLELCPAPLAEDDDVVAGTFFYVLSERVPEASVAPIPLALAYPDGGDDPAWLDRAGPVSGDVAGYGVAGGYTNSIGGDHGGRHVAFDSTPLHTLPALADPSDPASREPRAWRFTADGGELRVHTALLELEENWHDERGAAHLDVGAPWMLGTGASRRVYAMSIDELNPLTDRNWDAPLTPQTAPALRAFFDPDGDGLPRGSAYGARPGYVDADADGLAEYREVVRGAPGSDGCVDAVPPVAGRCWLATHDDNCAPPLGHATPRDFANPTQRDADGDLVGDACDVCPAVWDPEQATCVAAGDHSAGDRSVVDGELIGAACAFARHVDRNIDGDALPAWCDNCPATPNDDQADGDMDGVGDVCQDSDYDGIIDSLDDCPFTWDPAQELCNADVPQPHPLNGLPMGVACAPTPCANVEPVTTSSTDARGFTSEVSNDLVEGTGFVTHLEEVDVRLRRMCSVRRHEPTGAGTGLVRTGMRWCPCDGVRLGSEADRDRCADRFGCVRDHDAYTVHPEPRSRTWRSMTIDFERPRPFLAPRGDEAIIAYRAAPRRYATGLPLMPACRPGELLAPLAEETLPIGLRGRWDFAGDASREHSALIADLTSCDPSCAGTCDELGVCDPSGARPSPYLTDRVNPFSSESLVRAVGWAHSVRYERCDVPPCAGAGGTAPSGELLDSLGAGSDEASHYWSGETVLRTFSSGREPDFDPYFPFVIPFPEICWFCADAFPDLWLAHRACGPSGCAARWVARAEGADVPINDQLTLGAHVALTELELAWVLPRELKEHLGRGAVLGVGLDAQAQVIAQLAVTDAGTLGLVEEKGDPLPPPPNPNEIQVADVAFPQQASDGCRMDAPRARAGAVFLLANAHRLAAVGGEGEGSDHVTFTDLDTGRIRAIPIEGPRPGPVLAAAMHVTRMEALVLDEHVESRGRGARFARFLVVDLANGESRELARFPRSAAFDRYHLVGLADGRYALVATHERSERTWVFALAASHGELALSGWHRLRGVPLGAPVSSVRGLSIPFLSRGARTWAPVAVRAPDFAPCRQDDLRSVL